jgi:hypothetical protein
MFMLVLPGKNNVTYPNIAKIVIILTCKEDAYEDNLRFIERQILDNFLRQFSLPYATISRFLNESTDPSSRNHLLHPENPPRSLLQHLI